MMQPDVTVVDYGVGNILSIRRGLEYCGASVKVTASPADILAAKRVLLPGVGAFPLAISKLKERGLDIALREVAAREIPVLGICLGMQLLLDGSDEFGDSEGLGLIPGRVTAIPTLTADGRSIKVPNIGWHSIVCSSGRDNWSGSVLESVEEGQFLYFVHSYMACPENSNHKIAHCIHGDTAIAAVIAKDRVVGCQFHPEKSGRVGLEILRQFLSI